MNRPSLSKLYRRLASGDTATVPALNAEDLAAAADGALSADRRETVAEALAASPLHARVMQMLRDLKAHSQTLAADVALAQRDTTHRRQQRGVRRIAAHRRFGGVTRWAAALAACLVAVVGIWTQRHPVTTPDAITSSTHAVARADVIFSTRDRIFGVGMDNGEHGQSVRHEGDHLFRTDFSGG